MAMGESPASTETDLFLSYNRQDQDAVLRIRHLLELRGIRTFLDRDHLVAGLPWPQALEQALKSARAVAVFLGPHDFGFWQKREMFFALDLQIQAEGENWKLPVIPVLLKDAQPQPGFLFLNTWVDFRDSAGESLALETLLRAIEQDERSTARAYSSVCPYLGLQPFREEDHAFYFGREAFVEQLINKITHHRIVSVVGPSGSGKSSVVLAGLLPRLRRQRPPLLTWDAISFTPRDNPWWRLAYALMPLLEPDLSEPRRIEGTGILTRALLERNGALAGTFARVLERSRGTSRLLVVVDQFEEMFTLAGVDEELNDEKTRKEAEERKQKRAWFLEDLLASAKSTPINVVLTLRADYYSHALSASRELSDALEKGQVPLGPMLVDELRQAIERPAGLVGLDFEPGLVNRLLNDVAEEPGRLPLLEYALKRLWDKREDRSLTARAYDSFKGVTGAIGDEADRIYTSLSETEKNACRALFGRLVRVSPADTEGADTRRRATRQEIGEAGWQIALRLASPDLRLLVIALDPQTSHETAEVAHEALIRNWKRLRNWIQEDRDFLLWRQQLEVFLSVRESSGVSGEEALLRGFALQQALRWEKLNDGLNAREREFIADSKDAHERFGRRRLGIGLVSAVLVTLALIAGGLWYQAQQEKREAQEIVNTFFQGDGHAKEEYDALWRLAASRSDRTIRTVFEDFLANQNTAFVFNRHSEALQASVGLRIRSLNALRSVMVTEPCTTLVREYITACSTIAQLSGEQERLAILIVGLLAKAPRDEALRLGGALAALAPQLKGDQAERGANYIIGLLAEATRLDIGQLCSVLEVLAPQLKGDQAERGANRILELLAKGLAFQANGALAALAPRLKGDQAERLANRILGLLTTAARGGVVLAGGTGVEAGQLGPALAALAPRLKGDQAERGANLIVGLLPKATSFEAEQLGIALAALGPQLNQAESGAIRIIELLPKTRVYNYNDASDLYHALEALAPQLKGYQVERLANRIFELRVKATDFEARLLDLGLEALAPQFKGEQAERLAKRILELLAKAPRGEAALLDLALAGLAPQLKGDQAERGANLIVDLLPEATSFQAQQLGRALAALAPQLKGNQAERGADHILELLTTAAPGFEAEQLGIALAALAPQLKGDQAKRGANRILELLDKAKGTETAGLGLALAALASQLKGDQAEQTLLATFVDQRQVMQCGVAVLKVENTKLLVDMLKWPVCTDRDGIMLRIAELLQGSRSPEFGKFTEPNKRSTFRGDLRRFIAWLKTKRDSDGKPFDLDGPPVWSPGHTKRVFSLPTF
jgi:hypothetical protein